MTRRALLVGRRYWPHGCFDSAGYLSQLASDLSRHQLDVEVLTPRYASSWPEQLIRREIMIHRPAAAPHSDWSMGRYVRHLTSWIRDHRDRYDLIMVDSIRDEATAVIEATRNSSCAVVLRSSGWGEHSDTVWWQRSRAGRRCLQLAKTADRVVAKSAECERQLINHGFSPHRVYRIDNGFASTPTTKSISKTQARQALAAVNIDLMAEANAPVIVCNGRMTSDSGMNLLVRCARSLVTCYPNLRLWFLGDGPHRERIYEQLRGDGLRSSIAMPGTFIDDDDVLAAADLFVQADDSGLDYFLPKAICCEIPIVALDSEAVRYVLRPSRDARPANDVALFSPATPKALRIAIRSVLNDLGTARVQAIARRLELVRSRPQSVTIDAYQQLFEDVIRKRTGNQSSPSLGVSS